MNQSLISFKIDPSLNRIWSTIGLTQVERAEEAKKLEQELIKTYQEFIANATVNCEDLRSELRGALAEYQHTQLVFGDESPQPSINPRNSLRDQINDVYAQIDEMRAKYNHIVNEFEDVHATLQEQYQILRVPEEAQGEFAEIGDEDMTSERLSRFKEESRGLAAEIKQRSKLFETLASELREVLNCVQEFPPENVQKILDQGSLDNEAIRTIQESLSMFKEMRDNNEERIAKLWEKLENLYILLDISEKDQIQHPQNPSVEAIETLKNEITNLQEQANERVPLVIKEMRKEIKRLCNQLKLPNKMRPRFTGTSEQEEVVYLRGELKKLQAMQIKSQPIIDIICELETLRQTANQGNNELLTSRARGMSRKLANDEKKKKAARDKIAKLEQKLLNLLVKYKEENGYDFEFEGVDLQSLSNNESEKSSQYGIAAKKQETQMMVTTQKRSLGKALLLQKLNGAKASDDDAKQTKGNTKTSRSIAPGSSRRLQRNRDYY